MVQVMNLGGLFRILRGFDTGVVSEPWLTLDSRLLVPLF